MSDNQIINLLQILSYDKPQIPEITDNLKMQKYYCL